MPDSLHVHQDPTFDAAAWLEVQEKNCNLCTNSEPAFGRRFCGIDLKFPGCINRTRKPLPERPTKQQIEESGFNPIAGAI